MLYVGLFVILILLDRCCFSIAEMCSGILKI